MCNHDVIDEAGVEQFTFWKDDILCTESFDVVRCVECQHTFLLDDLHDLA